MTQWDSVADLAAGNTYYVDPDEFESTVSWSDVQPRQWGRYTLPVYVPAEMQGSDIDDPNLVHRSNFEVWQEMFEDSEDDKWVVLTGGYGSYGIAIRTDVTDDEIIETLAALESYPVIDDSRLSRMEMDATDEAWEDWVRGDFMHAIEKKTWKIDGRDAEIVDFDAGELDLRTWFEQMADQANEYWSTAGGAYIDVEKVVDSMDGRDIKKAMIDGAEVEIEAAED